VSTILKALEELEQRAPAAAASAAASTKYEQVPRPRSLTPLLLVLTAGSLVGMVYFAVRSAPKSASNPSAPAEPQRVSERAAADPLPLAAPAPRAAVEAAPPVRERFAAEEAPWGRVEKGSTIASAAAPPALPAVQAALPAVQPAPPPRAIVEPPVAPPRESSDVREESSHREAPSRRKEPSRQAEPLRREAAVRPPRQESPAASADRKPPAGTSSGADVEVMSIAYSENVGARSAALRIGGQTMTLHQGDSVRGMEVQLILRNSVYLRRGRDIFAVDAKR
jgi:hypothetical protein